MLLPEVVSLRGPSHLRGSEQGIGLKALAVIGLRRGSYSSRKYIPRGALSQRPPLAAWPEQGIGLGAPAMRPLVSFAHSPMQGQVAGGIFVIFALFYMNIGALPRRCRPFSLT